VGRRVKWEDKGELPAQPPVGLPVREIRDERLFVLRHPAEDLDRPAEDGCAADQGKCQQAGDHRSTSPLINPDMDCLKEPDYLVFLKLAVYVLSPSIVTESGLLVLVELPVHFEKM
jgi:hypothetical protein